MLLLGEPPPAEAAVFSLLPAAEADQEVEAAWRREAGVDADAAAAATEADPRGAGVGAGPSELSQSPFRLD